MASPNVSPGGETASGDFAEARRWAGAAVRGGPHPAVSPLDVLLVEPYYGGSHRAWADGYLARSRHRVRLVTHEGQLWRWRMRGGAVTLAEAVVADVEVHGRPDVVLVSDMVDLPALLGLTRRHLGDPAVVLYMHENQITYPLAPNQRPDEGLALVNWKSMVAADLVAFNSAFHRDAVLAGLGELLRRPADRRHDHLLPEVAARSAVWRAGVELRAIVDRPRATDSGPPLVLWNQRWEHDKNPEAVFEALVGLRDAGVAFRLALAGENVRVDPQDFERARRELGEAVVHVGYLERDDYLDLLARADVVVSAARHEFFGISVVEAVAAGAVPVLPDALSYPELIPDRWHHAVLYRPGQLAGALGRVLNDLDGTRAAVDGLRPAMARFDWRSVAADYDADLVELVSGVASRS